MSINSENIESSTFELQVRIATSIVNAVENFYFTRQLETIPHHIAFNVIRFGRRSYNQFKKCRQVSIVLEQCSPTEAAAATFKDVHNNEPFLLELDEPEHNIYYSNSVKFLCETVGNQLTCPSQLMTRNKLTFMIVDARKTLFGITSYDSLDSSSESYSSCFFYSSMPSSTAAQQQSLCNNQSQALENVNKASNFLLHRSIDTLEIGVNWLVREFVSRSFKPTLNRHEVVLVISHPPPPPPPISPQLASQQSSDHREFTNIENFLLSIAEPANNVNFAESLKFLLQPKTGFYVVMMIVSKRQSNQQTIPLIFSTVNKKKKLFEIRQKKTCIQSSSKTHLTKIVEEGEKEEECEDEKEVAEQEK